MNTKLKLYTYENCKWPNARKWISIIYYNYTILYNIWVETIVISILNRCKYFNCVFKIKIMRNKQYFYNLMGNIDMIILESCIGTE